MISHLPDESPVIKKLRKELTTKRQEKVRLESKLERLKDELLAVKHEHDVRIGRLLHESDMLDYALFEARKIKDLIEKGYSYDDAKKLVEERAYAEFSKREAADAAAEAEAGADASSAPLPKPKQSAEIKKLFRKLAHKYHPDLAEGNADKMKEINRAYADGNIEMLRAIERGEYDEPTADEIPNTELATHLRTIEMKIVRLKQRLRAFTRSEWYIIKNEIEKAKKEEQDFFAAWEKRLSSEIAKKKRDLTKAKRGIGVD
jgi:hypothetical protein